jgi:hypothetical protein
MSDTLKEKNKAKYKKACKKIWKDCREGKITDEEAFKMCEDLDIQFPKIEAFNWHRLREAKMFKLELEKKKDKIRLEEMKDV